MRIHTISFRHAWDGIWHAWISQPNFRVHLTFAGLAIILAILLKLDYWEWIALTMTITLGLVVEMINTALEFVVDLVTTEWKISAKIAKDVSAGAMLIYAIGSVLVGALLFIPKILWLYT
ncbi:diacylglycerol kinase family protein [Candidatus Amesbacteria bacterium]|nr:diacylglycerol kinase family protein [Candidatus Amesbacteria bacterium]